MENNTTIYKVVRKQSNDQICKLKSYLPSIIREEEQENQHKIKQNMFCQQNCEKLSIDDLNSIKPYSLVGKDMVNSYHRRITKRKSCSNNRRNQSLYSNSKKTTMRTNCSTKHLTKEDILSMICPKEKLRGQLTRIKEKLQFYNKIWKETTMAYKGYQSIYDQSQRFRSKVEKQEINDSYTNHLNLTSWENNLRKKKRQSVKLLKIQKNQKLTLKSGNKLKKQVNWINQKNGYIFEKLQGNKILNQTYKEYKNRKQQIR